MTRELRITLGRKSFTIMGFGVPLVLGIIAAILILTNKDKPMVQPSVSPTSGAPQMSATGYVDPGNLVEVIPNGAPSRWLTRFDDEKAAQSAMDAGIINAYYLIPNDYENSGELTYVQPNFSIISNNTDTRMMEWVLLVNLIGDQDLAAQLWNPVNTVPTSLATESPPSDEETWIVEIFPTLMTVILYLAIILSSSVLVAAVTDEKKNRIMEVLLSSVSTGQMITGKLIAVAILGMLLLLAWAGVFLFVALFGGRALDIPLNYSPPIDVLAWAAVFGFFGYAIYGALMAGVGALAPDVKDTRSASFVVLAPLIVAYMMMFIIETDPEGPIAMTLSLFPLTSPVSMIGRMSTSEVPIWQSFLAVVLQAAMAILIVRLVIRMFRAQTLLSGQSFDVKRYIGTLVGRGT